MAGRGMGPDPMCSLSQCLTEIPGLTLPAPWGKSGVTPRKAAEVTMVQERRLRPEPGDHQPSTAVTVVLLFGFWELREAPLRLALHVLESLENDYRGETA